MNTELQDQPYRQLALDIHAGASPFLEVRLTKQDDLDPQAIAQQLEQELNRTIERVLGSNRQLHLGRRLRVMVHPRTDMHYRTDLERWQEWTKSLDALRQDSAADLAWHEPTKAYVARRTAEGLSKREIIRCLKRYLAREVYRTINKTQAIAERI